MLDELFVIIARVGAAGLWCHCLPLGGTTI